MSLTDGLSCMSVSCDFPVQSIDLSCVFVDGKPTRIEARYVMRSEREWDRFMRFMERYAESAGLGFTKKWGVGSLFPVTPYFKRSCSASPFARMATCFAQMYCTSEILEWPVRSSWRMCSSHMLVSLMWLHFSQLYNALSRGHNVWWMHMHERRFFIDLSAWGTKCNITDWVSLTHTLQAIRQMKRSTVQSSPKYVQMNHIHQQWLSGVWG